MKISLHDISTDSRLQVVSLHEIVNDCALLSVNLCYKIHFHCIKFTLTGSDSDKSDKFM